MTDDESTKWDNYIASDSDQGRDDQGRDFELKQTGDRQSNDPFEA